MSKPHANMALCIAVALNFIAVVALGICMQIKISPLEVRCKISVGMPQSDVCNILGDPENIVTKNEGNIPYDILGSSISLTDWEYGYAYGVIYSCRILILFDENDRVAAIYRIDV